MGRVDQGYEGLAIVDCRAFAAGVFEFGEPTMPGAPFVTAPLGPDGPS